ncbi:NAD(P)-binding protein [Streptomyces sp. SID11385]|nr:NAD(P)-binding protein [Streptomyces sp. SID11385]
MPPQVLVAGAGPAGLTAAHELARRGVRVRLIDRAQGPATTSRALATHARTLEVWDQMGVADQLLPRGQRVEHFTLHRRGRQLIRFDTNYDALPTRFPYTLMVDQVITEEVLRDRLAAWGVAVEWSTELVGFEQDDTGVTARLRRPDGQPETLRTGWLVGTDGGHSTVRRKLELPLVGDSSETWLIADAVLDSDLPRDSIHWMDTGEGTVMLIPFPDPGKWRLLDTAEVTDDGPRQVADRFAAKISRAVGRQVRVEEPTWVSVFTIQQRMIATMRAGRCFLAGDAAHVHSPASGQGMNTGIQDAYNLGWKLAAVISGHSGPDLLDTYGQERVPVGRALLGSTRAATRLVAFRSAALSTLMPLGLGVLRRVRPLKRWIEHRIMGGMSGLTRGYADSALSAAGGGAGAGERIGWAAADTTEPEALSQRLREPRWMLWVNPAPEVPRRALKELLTDAAACPDTPVVLLLSPLDVADPRGLLARRLRLPAGHWALVRPDGYRCASGSGLPDPAGLLRRVGMTVPTAADRT